MRFVTFLEKGYVYRGLKPVYWCIVDSTALAEAEVEYEDHIQPVDLGVRYKLDQNRRHKNSGGAEGVRTSMP